MKTAQRKFSLRLILLALSTLVVAAAHANASSLNCSVTVENEGKSAHIVVDKAQPIDARASASIKQQFVLNGKFYELAATAMSSALVKGASTITTMQVVPPGWELRRYPEGGAYVSSERGTSQISQQDLFLVSESNGTKSYVTASCSIEK